MENTQKEDQKTELNIVCTNFIVQVREEQELTNGDKKEVKELTSGANGEFTLEGGAVIEANAGDIECYYDEDENDAYRIKNGKKIKADRETMKKAEEAQEAKGNVRKVETERGM